ncbi:MAG: hypothetical protein ACREQ5_11635 [Candidatus Dormibacteria bacterium]
MATVSANTHSQDIYLGTLVYATDATGVKPVNQGDIAVWDATLNGGNGAVRAAAAQADMAAYAGAATQSSFLNSLKEIEPTVAVAFKNVYMFKTTAAEVYKTGTKVFFLETADAQTITSSTNAGARTVAVGYVVLPNESLVAGSVTGAAGVSVPVAVTANFPVASLA